MCKPEDKRRKSGSLSSLLSRVPGWIKAGVLVLVVVLGLLGFLKLLWLPQLQDLDSLEQEIDKFLPSSDVKKRLRDRIDALQPLINNISNPTLKNQLKEEITKLEKQINDLPETVVQNDQLLLKKDKIALKKDWVNTQNALYGSLVQTLGGLFFFVTIILSWLSLRTTKETQVTERFSKAVELLGNDKQLAVRLGAIYALERIAKDSVEKDYWQTIEVLTGFVRERCKGWHKEETTLPDTHTERQRAFPPTDIQAVLKVLERRFNYYRQDETESPNLSNSDFSWMILAQVSFKKMNLRGANFSNADLSEAKFQGVDLSGTIFLEADLSRADLSGINLSSVKFAEIDPKTGKPIKAANLSYSILIEKDKTGKPIGADFSNINFSGVDLSGVDLSNAIFAQNTGLSYTQFVGATLSDANFSYAILSGADLSNATLKKANLNYAGLSEATLSNADLSEAILTNTVLKKANLQNAKFNNANLQNANLQNANLSGAILSDADLSDANLSGANLSDANLTGADVTHTDLRKALNLTKEQLEQADKGKDTVKRPTNF